MTQEELQNYILEKFPGLSLELSAHDLTLIIPLEKFRPFFEFLKNDPNLKFDNFMCMTAVDQGETLDVVYFLHSYEKRHRLAVKVKVNGDNPEVPTTTDLWPGANWHEREAYDLFGVKFLGHPDLRRILLPDDWEGHPMRKNYTHWNLVHLPDDKTLVTKDYPLTPSQTPYGV
jgi:NADH-quinone oxidoreductase subunit C